MRLNGSHLRWVIGAALAALVGVSVAADIGAQAQGRVAHTI